MRQLVHRARDRPSVRPLFFLGAAVLMIIVGLLGMHTLSAGPSGHGSMAMGQHLSMTAEQAAMPGDASPHADAFAAHSVAPMAGAAVSGAVDEAASGPHDGTMLACVLALLAGLLLLIAPALHRGVLLLASPRLARPFLAVTSVRPRPPSLVFLSISRT